MSNLRSTPKHTTLSIIGFQVKARNQIRVRFPNLGTKTSLAQITPSLIHRFVVSASCPLMMNLESAETNKLPCQMCLYPILVPSPCPAQRPRPKSGNSRSILGSSHRSPPANIKKEKYTKLLWSRGDDISLNSALPHKCTFFMLLYPQERKNKTILLKKNEWTNGLMQRDELRSGPQLVGRKIYIDIHVMRRKRIPTWILHPYSFVAGSS